MSFLNKDKLVIKFYRNMKIKNLKLCMKDFNKYGGVEDIIILFDIVWL